jgi:glyoxylase I family protein
MIRLAAPYRWRPLNSNVRHHTPHPATAMPPFSVQRIDHLVLRVRDLDASIAFYETVLGCAVARRRPELGLVHIRAGASMVDLVAVDGKLGRVGGEGPKAEGRNVDHLCLRIEPFHEQHIVEHLARFGIEPKGPASANFGAEGVGLSLYFADPDGNTIELKGPASSASDA